jgi:hypothetical protein
MVYNFAAINGLFVGFALFAWSTRRATKTVASDQKQLKQLLDYAALGYGFRMLLTFHVKHRPHIMRLKNYSVCGKCFNYSKQNKGATI